MRNARRRTAGPVMAIALLGGFSLVACSGQDGVELPPATPTAAPATNASTTEPIPVSTATPSTVATAVVTTVVRELPEPRIVDSGLSYTNEGTSLTWAALLEIPSDYPGPIGLIVEVDFVDADNRILDTKRESHGVVLPGQLLAVTGVVGGPIEGITRLDVRPILGDQEPDESAGEWIFSDVTQEVGEFGILHVTGFVSHTFPDDKKNVIISNVYYLDGQIVGGDFGPVPRVPPGREARFELVSNSAPEFDEIEQYVSSYRIPPGGSATVTTVGQVLPEPRVIDSGLGYSKDGTFLSWAALIEIPSDYPSPTDLWVEVEFLDDRDRIVGNARSTSRVVFPGHTVAATGLSLPPVEGITRLDVFPILGLSNPDETEGEWVINEVAYEIDEYGPKITGFISHTFPDDKANLFISVVYYRDGRIVGGDHRPVERAPVGQEVRFELRSVTEIEFDNIELDVWSYHNS